VKTPDFDELVGEVDDLERGRLRRVHEALVAAGPPPELPPTLAEPPRATHDPRVRTPASGWPRRRLGAALVLAAALALAAFGGGYLVGDEPEAAAFEQDFGFVMHGTDAAPEASASVAVGHRDEGGNWPMIMTVRDLEELPGEEHYELRLTRDGELADSCGTFAVAGDKTVVYLNAPYRLRDFDGWVVTREGGDEILLRTDEI
jgi:hypothetical protein